MEENSTSQPTEESLNTFKTQLLSEIAYYDNRQARLSELVNRRSYLKSSAVRQEKIKRRLAFAATQVQQTTTLLEQVNLLLKKYQ